MGLSVLTPSTSMPKKVFDDCRVNEDNPIDSIKVCYVINEIMTPEEHGDFSVQLPFFEIPKNKINRLVIRTESSNYKPFFSNLNKNCSNRYISNEVY